MWKSNTQSSTNQIYTVKHISNDYCAFKMYNVLPAIQRNKFIRQPDYQLLLFFVFVLCFGMFFFELWLYDSSSNQSQYKKNYSRERITIWCSNRSICDLYFVYHFWWILFSVFVVTVERIPSASLYVTRNLTKNCLCSEK